MASQRSTSVADELRAFARARRREARLSASANEPAGMSGKLVRGNARLGQDARPAEDLATDSGRGAGRAAGHVGRGLRELADALARSTASAAESAADRD